MQNKDRTLKYSEAISEATKLEMQRDPSVFVLGLDVDDHKAIQGSTAGLVEEFGKDRCFSTPLSEDAMTGVAIGAAMAGMRPIHVHIRMDFLLLCMNQLYNMGVKAHYMYNGQVKVPLVVRAMIGRSWGQGAQHSQALHSLFMHVPGIKVVAPSNAYDAKGILAASIRDNNPVLCVEHRLLYNTEAFVPADNYIIKIGKGRIISKGDDITLVAISHMVTEAKRSVNYLKQVGINAELIDPISLKPLDIDLIVKSVRKTKRLLVVDNGWLTCGAASEIITQTLEALQKEGGTTAQFKRMGFAETTCPTTRCLEDFFYPNAKTIAEAASKMVGIKTIRWNSIKQTESEEVERFKGPF
ncbi:MAG: transketolase C-terminal domain-containing protein [Rickettsiales bacterium]